MNNDSKLYIENLSKEIKRKGYNEHYTKKCINYATHLLNNNLPVIFDTKHLSLLIGVSVVYLVKMVFAEKMFYKQIKIPKRSGGFRELNVPSLELKYIQKWILNNILYKIKVSEYATGFCNKKSILYNAKIHLNKHCVVNMDIKDFFGSISFERVFRIFYYYGYTNEVSFVLAKLCTFDGKLPQGSPASPYISNIACLKLDARLNALASKYEAKYSRYADDLTFSSDNDIKSIIKMATSIVNDEKFIINNKKTRIAYPYQRQEVTGLIVNGKKVSIPKKYKRSIYQELYYCLKYGVQDHMQYINCDNAFYKEHVYGKIYFVNMIEPEEAERLFELANKIQWDY